MVVQRRIVFLWAWCIPLFFGVGPKSAYAADPSEPGLRHLGWFVRSGIGLLETFDENKQFSLQGETALFSLGVSHTSHRFHYDAAVDFNLGPYRELKRQNVKLELSSSGVSIAIIASLTADGLRHERGAFGLLVGLSYKSFEGSSSQRFELESPEPLSVRKINTTFDLVSIRTGIALLGFKPHRLQTDEPANLVTRFEGWMARAYVDYSLRSHAKLKYNLRPEGQFEVEEPFYAMMWGVDFTIVLGV